MAVVRLHLYASAGLLIDWKAIEGLTIIRYIGLHLTVQNASQISS